MIARVGVEGGGDRSPAILPLVVTAAPDFHARPAPGVFLLDAADDDVDDTSTAAAAAVVRAYVPSRVGRTPLPRDTFHT